MILQLVLGTALLLMSILVAGVAYVALEGLMIRAESWARRPPHRPRIVALVCLAMLAVMGQLTVSVWIWAVAFRALGAFEAMEPAVYFALVTFTTLGFGDILLPEPWRLLGGMAAANGLMNVGLLTALLVETLRGVRKLQLSERGSAA